MEANKDEVDWILDTLKDAQKRIAAASKGVSLAKLHAHAGKKTWSINDILAHIRSSSDVWGDSIEAMLTKEMPALPNIHPRKWIKQTNYPQLDFHTSFMAYTEQRKKLLKTLTKLSFEDWSRGAIIGGRVHTVFTQARRIAKHDSDHCEQIEGLLRK
jgi:hypothetical protein